MMNRVFEKKIGQNLEFYVDDIIVKSLTKELHIKDLEETFQCLDTFNIKLNPTRWTFGASAGKFLGFMLMERGIEVNLDKCKAVLTMQSHKNVKKV